jgi:ferritin-like metal-binding protein YciE
MEHYEIGCYESAIAIAEQLGLQDVVEPLRQSLEEERRADQKIAAAAMVLIRAQVPMETE